MNVFVTGVNGQHVHDVVNELVKRVYEVFASDVAPTNVGGADETAVTTALYVAFDITNKEVVALSIKEINPGAIIDCATWTAVDMTEDDDKVELVMAVNVGGPPNIAEVCQKLDCMMIYLSTDYVFGGQGAGPWQPHCKDYKPLNVYGQSKLEGELVVAVLLERYFIVYIAWMFGKNGKDFIKTILNVGKTHDTVRVDNDQIGTPTYIFDFARLLVNMVETEKYGDYHVTNKGGYISWYNFTVEIFRQAGMKITVVPLTTEEYELSKAARPNNSRLNNSKLLKFGFTPHPTRQEAVGRYLKELI